MRHIIHLITGGVIVSGLFLFRAEIFGLLHHKMSTESHTTTKLEIPHLAVTSRPYCCDALDTDNFGILNKSTDMQFISSWKKSNERESLPVALQAISSEGNIISIAGFTGKPVVLSFAYTRCINPNKCMLATKTFGQLQSKLTDLGLAEKVVLGLITYDPKNDNKEVFSKYAALNGFRAGPNALLLRPPPDKTEAFFRQLKVPVSFNNITGVSLHTIHLVILDKWGHIARVYDTLIWDNDRVAADVEMLVNEVEK